MDTLPRCVPNNLQSRPIGRSKIRRAENFTFPRAENFLFPRAYYSALNSYSREHRKGRWMDTLPRCVPNNLQSRPIGRSKIRRAENFTFPRAEISYSRELTTQLRILIPESCKFRDPQAARQRTQQTRRTHRWQPCPVLPPAAC